ncbi:hypothetical protein [Actinokineospora inagensis]|uniref:hypothetical protein n=1 Tax=Actinokineospora inagensis TaxID=103730 RepID=UPI0003FE43BF|nr:hypothetical protein [Actinokineospora inagensis]
MRWDQLPTPVRDAVVGCLGPVLGAEDAITGSTADLAAVLRLADGTRVFVKAVAGVSRRMRWLRNEIAGNHAAADLAPPVLFHTDLDVPDGEHWLIVGFTHLPGRPASLAPDSPDLPLIADALEHLATLPATPPIRPLRDRWAPTDWWTRVADLDPGLVADLDLVALTRLTQHVPELVDGDRLTHTDLHGDQIRIGHDGTLHIIDWGFPAAAAPWVDTAFLTLRLIEAGHTPTSAEAWARDRATLTGVNDATLTAFTAYLAGLWTHIALTGGHGSPRRAQLAREHLTRRLNSIHP